MSLFCSTIDRVAEQGVADRRHVHAHLMRAPGFQPAFDQRGVAQRLRACGNASPRACRPRRSRPSCGSAGERASGASTVPAGGRGLPADDRLVAPVDDVVGELLRQPLMRAVGLGGDHQPATCPCRCGGRSPAARPRRCPTAMPPQWWSSALTSVPSRLPAAGMDDQPGGLVDHDQMLVLERDDERDVLRLVVRAASGSGTATANMSPAAARLAPDRAPARRRAVTAPGEISTFSRSRDSVGTASASARSSRQPSAAAGDRRFDDGNPPVHSARDVGDDVGDFKRRAATRSGARRRRSPDAEVCGLLFGDGGRGRRGAAVPQRRRRSARPRSRSIPPRCSPRIARRAAGGPADRRLLPFASRRATPTPSPRDAAAAAPDGCALADRRRRATSRLLARGRGRRDRTAGSIRYADARSIDGLRRLQPRAPHRRKAQPIIRSAMP